MGGIHMQENHGTVSIQGDWLTPGQVAKETGVDTQRVRRMVDNGLVGDFSNGIRLIHRNDLTIVKQIADYMDHTPNATYEKAKKELLKDELVIKHEKEQEISTFEQAYEQSNEKLLNALGHVFRENNEALRDEMKEMLIQTIREEMNVQQQEKMKARHQYESLLKLNDAKDKELETYKQALTQQEKHTQAIQEQLNKITELVEKQQEKPKTGFFSWFKKSAK